MNAAHAHLIINHFPIVSLIIGTIVLLSGLLTKSSVTRRIGLFIFLFTGITSLIASATGNGAKEQLIKSIEQREGTIDCPNAIVQIVEKVNDAEERIQKHEQLADESMSLLWGLSALSLLALLLEFRRKSMAVPASTIVLIVGLISIYFMKEIATSGGEIAHPEIRKE